MRDQKHFAVLAMTFGLVGGLLGGCAVDMPSAAGLTTSSVDPVPTAKTAKAAHGTRVTSDAPARVFVMAGLAGDCSPISIPMITVGQAPTKGTVSFIPVPDTTVQFSLSGRCVGKRVPGVAVFYKANDGATGPDVFSVVARSGTRELASRTIPVEIAY